MRRASSTSRLSGALRAALYGNAIYAWMLSGKPVEALRGVSNEPWPGDPDIGAMLLADRFAFRDLVAQGNGGAPWTAEMPEGWLVDLHRFGWIRHLRALNGVNGGSDARRKTRQLVLDWIDSFHSWSDFAWRAEIVGPRIANWLGAHDFFLASADHEVRLAVLDSVARQARHLARSLPGALQGADLIGAIKGLVIAGAGLPDGDKLLGVAARLLDSVLPRQVLPDGGHVQRNPAVHLAVLRDLIDMRAALRAARLPVPDALQMALDRMAPALRYFMHGDGRLALFNGGHEANGEEIALALQAADVRGRPVRSAVHSGFQRVLAGRTVVIMDVGRPPAGVPGFAAHAGPFAFEMSIGRHRMIVNCGAHCGEGQAAQAWRFALRGTAAHSTLSVAGADAIPVLEQGGFAQRLDTVRCKRSEHDRDVLLEGHHDGFASRFGVTHWRRLYVAADGEDVRGEDSLFGREGVPFAIRFHLHPSVEVSVDDGEVDAVVLRMPNGQLWRLRASHPITLEHSVYFADGLTHSPSAQMVIVGTTKAKESTVKWTISRLVDGAE
jgi:uncharacterized heparinase superfamily protein